MSCRFPAALLLTALVPLCAGQSPLQPGSLLSAAAEPARAELVSDHTQVSPGEIFRIAVRLVMQPGWHVYWKEPGDSGIPTTIRWNLPEGFPQPLSTQWPAPRYFTSPGNLRSIGYQDEAAILATFRVPPGWKGPISIAADIRWLACKELCIPGRTTLQTTLNVAGSSSAAHPELFERWSRKLPANLAATPGSPATVEPAGNGYRIHLQEDSPIEEPAAFVCPEEPSGYTAVVGELRGPRCTIEVSPGHSEPGKPAEVVITWKTQRGGPRAIILNLPPVKEPKNHKD